MDVGHREPRDIRPETIDPRITLTDDGLVCGAGTILARMTARGVPRLALDDDGDRCVALLSIALGHPVPANTLVHIETASAYWHQGDKALANLRLAFAGLPRLPNSDAAYRLRLAAHLLDNGMTPAALLDELALDKDLETELRVGPGHGDKSGEWTDSITVAMTEGPPKDEEQRKEEHLGGSVPPQVTVGGTRPLDPFSSLPSGAGAGDDVNQAVEAARKAKENVGPGRGPVYGTAVHQEYKRLIEEMRNPNLSTEKSYMDGEEVRRGTSGSVRLDAVVGPLDKPTAILDLKTGSSQWNPGRDNSVRSHLPRGSQNIPIYVVRP